MFEEGKKYYQCELRPLENEFSESDKAHIGALLRAEIRDAESSDEGWARSFFQEGGPFYFVWPDADAEARIINLLAFCRVRIRVGSLGRDCPSDCGYCCSAPDCPSNYCCLPIFKEDDWIFPPLSVDEIEARVISAPSLVFFWKLHKESEDVRECVEAYFEVNDLEVVENGALPVKEKQQWCSSDTVTDFCARVAAVLQR